MQVNPDGNLCIFVYLKQNKSQQVCNTDNHLSFQLHAVSPDEGQMHPQGPVGPRAVYTEEHTVGDAGPAGVFSCAVKANLKRPESKASMQD